MAVIDEYPTSNHGSDYRNCASDSNFGIAQAFAGAAAEIVDAVLYLVKVGAPTGNATITLYSVTGTYGTDAIPDTSIAVATSTFDVSTLTTSVTMTTFTFAPGTNLSAGTNYAIAIEYSGGSVAGGNYIRWGTDNSAPSHGGNISFKSSIGVWTASAARDAIFQITGTFGTNPARVVVIRQAPNRASTY